MPNNNEEYQKIYETGKMLCEQGQMLMEMAEGAGYVEDEEMTEEFDVGDDLEDAIEASKPGGEYGDTDKQKDPAKEKRKGLAIAILAKKMGKK